ncbi:MAG: rhamnan synthesis F family protein [Porticoccaceae bacterium]
MLEDIKGFKLSVHLHLFHTEMADEFVEYLCNIPEKFNLFISISENEFLDWQDYFLSNIPNACNCKVIIAENIGRDVAPWVIDFANDIIESDVFCHIHTKRSDYNSSLSSWKNYLLKHTLGSQKTVSYILERFRSNNRLGLVYPPYFPSLTNQPHWGGNRATVASLLAKLNMPSPPIRCADFPAGSFFWARTHCLKPLLDLGLDRSDFPTEQGQIDGTLAHAIERLVGLLPLAQGMIAECVHYQD